MAKSQRQKKKKTKSIQQISAPRNPFVQHPLMTKSATHEKSRKALRANARRETKLIARDWVSSIKSYFLN
ncbi:MAG: hypothetical protein KUG78_00635 [Kangiellaceae bacterium]|nr:hypothetical protein [Kangiellaceae bacterium]